MCFLAGELSCVKNQSILSKFILKNCELSAFPTVIAILFSKLVHKNKYLDLKETAISVARIEFS